MNKLIELNQNEITAVSGGGFFSKTFGLIFGAAGYYGTDRSSSFVTAVGVAYAWKKIGNAIGGWIDGKLENKDSYSYYGY